MSIFIPFTYVTDLRNERSGSIMLNSIVAFVDLANGGCNIITNEGRHFQAAESAAILAARVETAHKMTKRTEDAFHTDKLFLDVEFERARSNHRILRAINDGECPRCTARGNNQIKGSDAMRPPAYDVFRHVAFLCPTCGLQITKEQERIVLNNFANIMRLNLDVWDETFPESTSLSFSLFPGQQS